MQGIEKKTSAFFLVECDAEFGNNKKPWKYIYICVCIIYNIVNILYIIYITLCKLSRTYLNI